MQARIVQLIEDRTEALAALSHDLRTPLARLRLRAGFLPEGEERARIEEEVMEMEAMVSSVLDYFREGQDAEPAVSTDVSAILQTLADESAEGITLPALMETFSVEWEKQKIRGFAPCQLLAPACRKLAPALSDRPPSTF